MVLSWIWQAQVFGFEGLEYWVWRTEWWSRMRQAKQAKLSNMGIQTKNRLYGSEGGLIISKYYNTLGGKFIQW